MAKFTVTGIKSIDAKLKSLEPKVAKKVIRRAGRQALKQAVLPEAKALAPVGTGQLKKAIKVRSGGRSRKAILMDVQVGQGTFKGDQFYGGFQEWGWQAGPTKVEGKHYMKQAYEKRGDKARQMALDEIWRGITDILEGR